MASRTLPDLSVLYLPMHVACRVTCSFHIAAVMTLVHREWKCYSTDGSSFKWAAIHLTPETFPLWWPRERDRCSRHWKAFIDIVTMSSPSESKSILLGLVCFRFQKNVLKENMKKSKVFPLRCCLTYLIFRSKRDAKLECVIQLFLSLYSESWLSRKTGDVSDINSANVIPSPRRKKSG